MAVSPGLCVLILLLGSCIAVSPTPTVTFSLTPTDTESPSESQFPTATNSSTLTFSVTVSASESRSETPSPSNTSTPTASITSTPSPSRTSSVTVTPTISLTGSASPTSASSASSTPSVTASITATPSVTSSISLTATASPTSAASASLTPSVSLTSSTTNTATATVTPTPSCTSSVSFSASVTSSPSFSSTNSATPSITPTISNTGSITPTISHTASKTPTKSYSSTPVPSPVVVDIYIRPSVVTHPLSLLYGQSCIFRINTAVDGRTGNVIFTSLVRSLAGGSVSYLRDGTIPDQSNYVKFTNNFNGASLTTTGSGVWYLLVTATTDYYGEAQFWLGDANGIYAVTPVPTPSPPSAPDWLLPVAIVGGCLLLIVLSWLCYCCVSRLLSMRRKKITMAKQAAPKGPPKAAPKQSPRPRPRSPPVYAMYPPPPPPMMFYPVPYSRPPPYGPPAYSQELVPYGFSDLPDGFAPSPPLDDEALWEGQPEYGQHYGETFGADSSVPVAPRYDSTARNAPARYDSNARGAGYRRFDDDYDTVVDDQMVHGPAFPDDDDYDNGGYGTVARNLSREFGAAPATPAAAGARAAASPARAPAPAPAPAAAGGGQESRVLKNGVPVGLGPLNPLDTRRSPYSQRGVEMKPGQRAQLPSTPR